MYMLYLVTTDVSSIEQTIDTTYYTTEQYAATWLNDRSKQMSVSSTDYLHEAKEGKITLLALAII